jgi:hypothetical protein
MNGFSLSVTQAINCGHRQGTCYKTPVSLPLLLVASLVDETGSDIV